MSEEQQEQGVEQQRDVFTFIVTLLFICLVAVAAHGFFEYGARRAVREKEKNSVAQVKPEQPAARKEAKKSGTRKAAKKRGSRKKAE